MTEQEWNSDSLWDHFNPYKHRDREKLRSLTCACARRALDVVGSTAHPAFAGIVDVAERYAGGQATREELLAARKLLRQTIQEVGPRAVHQISVVAVVAELTDNTVEGFEHMLQRAEAVLKKHLGRKLQAEKVVLSGLVRDIFGNPFRSISFDPTWRTDTAIGLAQQMYNSRDFSAMPILADALQDAGCDNNDILSHCRDAKQVHARGCWVIDLLLRK